MFDDVGKALEYLRLNAPMGDDAARCITEELISLHRELARMYGFMAAWIERLDSIEASILRLAEK